ncbi:MAG: hypothetical protein K0S47_507 [Herbinix sp.]|jgi:hypothetical protein|nr:hypothetical protein [Herbinix sp.]
MNFKEIMERYVNHTATEQEIKMVEEELLRYQVLTDYYAETEDYKLQFDEPQLKSNKVEMKKIRRAVKRNNIILVGMSLILVLTMYFAYNNMIKPYLTKEVLYNPDIHTYSEFTSDLTMVLATLTELHFPNKITNDIVIKNTGLDSYDLTIYQHDKMKGFEYQYGTIEHGSIELLRGFYEFPVINSFIYSTYPFYVGQGYDKGETLNKLKVLPDYTKVQANISFDRDITMDELIELEVKNPNIYLSWVGIRNGERNKQILPLIGMDPTGSGYIYEELNSIYPYYELALYEDRHTAKAYDSHFKALLQFQLDHIDTLNRLNDANYNKQGYYQAVYDYVQENGVTSYGIVITGKPQDVINLCDEDYICNLSVEDIEWSIY